MITLADIERAYQIVQPVVHQTPLLSSRTLNGETGNDVFFKAENFQRVGAFKIRGAYNKIASLTLPERQRGVVAHSSGNHAQGVALAARLLGVRATIVMPKFAPPIKVAATRSYGAEIVFCEDSSDDRERVTAELQREYGFVPVPPYDDDEVIAGQGTVAVEIAKQIEHLEYLFVPIGGGGLISGCAVAAKHLFPGIQVVGVETEAASDCYQSFRQKRIVRIDPPATIADGMRTQSVGERNFQIIMKLVDDVVTVSEEQVMEMMRFFLQRMKIVVEPTGAVAPAAVFFNVKGISNKRICAIISGGNIDPALLKSIL
jgi:threonine ammonia-lyase medium form